MVRNLVLPVLLVGTSAFGSSPSRTFDPSAFSAIPKEVVTFYKEAKCQIPQSGMPKPNNLIYGAFAKSGQKDWAALCLDGTHSKILMKWGGPTTCPSEVSRDENSRYVSNLSDGTTELTRGLEKIPYSSANVGRTKFEGDGKFRNFKHDAMNDAIIERTSTVLYCNSGKWITAAGAD